MVSEREFNALLVQYRPYIISQVMRNGGGGEDAEDHVQNAILQLCRVRRNFDPEKGAFPTWVWWQVRSYMQIARKRIQNRRAINHSMEYYEDGVPLSEAVALGNQQDHVELSATLDAIGELDPRQADVVLQMAVGATLNEVATKYEISRERVRQLRVGGLKKVCKKLNRTPSGVMMGAY
jgi:RNA polymerase sigma factor (sigma-70 family)